LAGAVITNMRVPANIELTKADAEWQYMMLLSVFGAPESSHFTSVAKRLAFHFCCTAHFAISV
jgi:hypothetical protein